MNKQFFVYILRTDKNSLYTGYTDDIQNRLKVHRTTNGAKYLRKFKNFELIYQEIFVSKSMAMKREAQIKKLTKSEKEKLARCK